MGPLSVPIAGSMMSQVGASGSLVGFRSFQTIHVCFSMVHSDEHIEVDGMVTWKTTFLYLPRGVPCDVYTSECISLHSFVMLRLLLIWTGHACKRAGAPPV